MTSERLSRLIEAGLVMAVSVGASAITVSWTLSASLENIRTRMNADEVRIAQSETDLRDVTRMNSLQETAISVTTSQYSEIIRRLDQMERKQEAQARR